MQSQSSAVLGGKKSYTRSLAVLEILNHTALAAQPFQAVIYFILLKILSNQVVPTMGQVLHSNECFEQPWHSELGLLGPR